MGKICCILFLLLNIGGIQKFTTSDFEGSIIFVKKTLYDTTYFYFLVKHNLVRIDEKNARNEIIQSLIVDTKTKNIIALSPSQKLYTNIYKNRISLPNESMVNKTNNFKYIDGYKCTLWRVRNSTFNTEVSLWAYPGNLTFYSEVTELLGKTEDYAQYCNYFNIVPGNSGFLPILVIERTLLREEKFRIQLKELRHQKLNDQVFQVPKDYKCLLN
jgi:hypothetical protein